MQKERKKHVYKEHNLTSDKDNRQTNSMTINTICSPNMRNSTDSNDRYNTNVIITKE